jgi:nucleotide-binding universal stress UspA family protein
MRALVWIVENTWEACVDEARSLLPEDAEISILHVAPEHVEAIMEGASAGLLGRRRGARGPDIRQISDEAAASLLASAGERLGRPAQTFARRGRVERVVVEACADADLVLFARDGDAGRLGPRTLGRAGRFVVDHAPCRVVLVWAEPVPGLELPPPPPPGPEPSPPGWE